MRFYCWALAQPTLAIDVRRWGREKLLIPNQSFFWSWFRNGEKDASIQVRTEWNQIVLTYRYRDCDDEWKDQSYPIRIVWTVCNYGNKRPWFLCPAKNCVRRVAILYSGNIFACRRCYQLAYQSQRETITDRATRRGDKIRDKLGWEPGILNGDGLRPRGMHWKTFARLHAQHDDCLDQSLQWLRRRLFTLEN